MKNRIMSFAWRYGAFVGIACASYLMNIADIREIDFWKLGTIFTITTATYIFNEFTKYFNTQKTELTVKKVVAKKKK